MKGFERDISDTPVDELLHPSRLLAIGRKAVRQSSFIAFPGEPNQLDVLRELEPAVGDEINRHNRVRKLWLPADFLPLDSDGRVLHRHTDPDKAPMLSPVAHAAMVVNLLTEDNLPSYHRVIANNFGLDGPWGTWVNQWTTEEDSHAYVMRAFLDLTRAVDPHELEAARFEQMKRGYMVEKSPLHTLAYVTFQELATRVSHRQTGIACKNELADAMLTRIAMDENFHMIFYRNLANAALDVAPNQMICAIRDELLHFEMPGSNIDGFKIKALQIAEAGIYDPRRHLNEVVSPTLKYWKIDERTFTGEGAAAYDELQGYLKKLEVTAKKFEERRDDGTLARTIAALQSRQ